MLTHLKLHYSHLIILIETEQVTHDYLQPSAKQYWCKKLQLCKYTSIMFWLYPYLHLKIVPLLAYRWSRYTYCHILKKTCGVCLSAPGIFHFSLIISISTLFIPDVDFILFHGWVTVPCLHKPHFFLCSYPLTASKVDNISQFLSIVIL